MEKKLNPAEEYELKFLRQRVDELSEKRHKLEYHGDVNRDHERATKELKQFVFK